MNYRIEKETKRMKGRNHSKNPSISVCNSQEWKPLLVICPNLINPISN